MSRVNVAGVDIPKQEIALAEEGAWNGDTISSGIVGLGLKLLTEAHTAQGQTLTYDPVVITMQSQGIAPLFSVGLSRDDSQSFLALGGVPDVQTGDYGTTPILQVGFHHIESL